MAANEMKQSWYERRVLPHLLDLACNVRPVQQQRRLVVPQARGRVLELGIGSGLNLAHYEQAHVTEVVGVDPANQSRRLIDARIAASGLHVELIVMSAEKMPLPDSSFDTVVMTYTLCSIPDPVAALAEVRRLLKPSGRLLFCEHGRAPDDSVRRWQRRINPWWGRIAGGCHLDRDIPALLTQAGLTACDLHAGYIQGPRPLTYNYWGSATVADQAHAVTRAH
jgi:ubiquinone/menaquinone biosynthesis C-methylase UbiE